MAEKTTIAIATVMPLPCGPFPSIPQSTLVKTPIMTKVVPQLWHQLSQMAPKTLIREWQPLICMANVPGLTPEHRRQLQKLLEFLPLPSKPSKAQKWFHVKSELKKKCLISAENWLGETCNIWLYSLPKEIPSLIPKVASIGPWTESAWNSIICLDSESWTPEQWWLLPNNGKPYQPDTIVRLDLTKLSDPFHQTNHSSSHWKPRLVLARKRKSTILNMFKQVSNEVAWFVILKIAWHLRNSSIPVISLNTSRRGDVELFLRSPMGTRSMILSTRPNDDDSRYVLMRLRNFFLKVPWHWRDFSLSLGMASLNGPSWPHTLGLSIQEENGLLR